jgi:hypothetical protein
MYQFYVKTLVDYLQDRALNKKVKTCSVCHVGFSNMEEMWLHKHEAHG